MVENNADWSGQIIWMPYEPVEGGEGTVAEVIGYKFPSLSKLCTGTVFGRIPTPCRAIKYGPMREDFDGILRVRCEKCLDRMRIENVSLETLIPTVLEHVAAGMPLVIQNTPVDGWPDSHTIFLASTEIDFNRVELEVISQAGSLETALLAALKPRTPKLPLSKAVKKTVKETIGEGLTKDG